MTPDQLFQEFKHGFPQRKFTAGLLVALIDLITALEVPGKGIGSYEKLIEAFPRQTKTAGGKRANTLILMKPDGRTLSLRGFYNEAEKFYRADNKRFDYPSAARDAGMAGLYGMDRCACDLHRQTAGGVSGLYFTRNSKSSSVMG